MKNKIYIIGIIVLALSGFIGSLRGEEATVVSKTASDTGALLKALKGDVVEPKLRAKAALIRMGEKAGPPVQKALSDVSPGASYDLIEILSIIRYSPAAGEIEKIWQDTEDIKIKLVAAQALCRFDHKYDRYQSYIISRTNTGDNNERLEAMQMLGYIGDKRVVEPLVQIFNDPNRSDQIRQAAIWDLGHTPVKESAEALVNLVDDAKVDWFYKEIIIASIKTLATNKEMAPIISELLAKAQNIPVPARKGK